MKKQCMGLINLDKKGNPNINILNYARPLASTPIAGRYRIIDFVLSNMVNSGITNVGIYAKEKYRSLTDHLGSGKDWDLSRKKGGLYIFSPENTKYNNNYGFRTGDVYSILANIDYIEKSPEEYVIVAPSYMLCSIDYNDLLKYYGSNVLEMLNNPVKTFTYFGFRFLTLEQIIQFKKNRNESKDRDDIKLIQLFLSDNKKNNKIKWIQVKRRMIAKTQGVILKVAHKTGTYDFLRAIYKKIKGAH